ncbi:hypothetical protein CROQUDRAFT_86844, partial [Cronartium quercuum f. sp. fusiforme G11]
MPSIAGNPMPMPPIAPPGTHVRSLDHPPQEANALNAQIGSRSWADEMDEVDLNHPLSTEDELMETWLEATKHTNIDGSINLPPVV